VPAVRFNSCRNDLSAYVQPTNIDISYTYNTRLCYINVADIVSAVRAIVVNIILFFCRRPCPDRAGTAVYIVVIVCVSNDDIGNGITITHDASIYS